MTTHHFEPDQRQNGVLFEHFHRRIVAAFFAHNVNLQARLSAERNAESLKHHACINTFAWLKTNAHSFSHHNTLWLRKARWIKFSIAEPRFGGLPPWLHLRLHFSVSSSALSVYTRVAWASPYTLPNLNMKANGRRVRDGAPVCTPSAQTDRIINGARPLNSEPLLFLPHHASFCIALKQNSSRDSLYIHSSVCGINKFRIKRFVQPMRLM